MQERKTFQPILVIAAIVALIGGVWAGFYSDKKQVMPPEIYGTLLPSGKALGKFQLTDHNNQAFTENNFLGNWSLVFIGYTHCPDVCPTTLATLQQTAEMMQSQTLSVPKVVFISIDPDRDTVDVLSNYITYFNKDFLAATGSQEQLKNISHQMAAFYGKAAGASGDINNKDYLMDHSASLILINPDAEIQAFLAGPHIPEQVIESIKRSEEYYANTH